MHTRALRKGGMIRSGDGVASDRGRNRSASIASSDSEAMDLEEILDLFDRNDEQDPHIISSWKLAAELCEMLQGNTTVQNLSIGINRLLEMNDYRQVASRMDETSGMDEVETLVTPKLSGLLSYLKLPPGSPKAALTKVKLESVERLVMNLDFDIGKVGKMNAGIKSALLRALASNPNRFALECDANTALPAPALAHFLQTTQSVDRLDLRHLAFDEPLEDSTKEMIVEAFKANTSLQALALYVTVPSWMGIAGAILAGLKEHVKLQELEIHGSIFMDYLPFPTSLPELLQSTATKLQSVKIERQYLNQAYWSLLRPALQACQVPNLVWEGCGFSMEAAAGLAQVLMADTTATATSSTNADVVDLKLHSIMPRDPILHPTHLGHLFKIPARSTIRVCELHASVIEPFTLQAVAHYLPMSVYMRSVKLTLHLDYQVNPPTTEQMQAIPVEFLAAQEPLAIQKLLVAAVKRNGSLKEFAVEDEYHGYQLDEEMERKIQTYLKRNRLLPQMLPGQSLEDTDATQANNGTPANDESTAPSDGTNDESTSKTPLTSYPTLIVAGSATGHMSPTTVLKGLSSSCLTE